MHYRKHKQTTMLHIPLPTRLSLVFIKASVRFMHTHFSTALTLHHKLRITLRSLDILAIDLLALGQDFRYRAVDEAGHSLRKMRSGRG